MKKNIWKRLMSLALSLMLVVSCVPAPAHAAEADNLCAHHTQHTPECGYSAVDSKACAFNCHICPVQELVDACRT